MSLKGKLLCVGQTDTGRVREHNEDMIAVDSDLGLVVLADGMGGYNAGEVASGMATALLGSRLAEVFELVPPYATVGDGRRQAVVALEQEIAITNKSIYSAAQSQPQYAGMGTTLVTAVFHDNSMTVAHIGDSRMYRLRDGALSPVTRDHSLLQEQIDSGMLTPEQARHSQNRNLVTRALGVDPEVEPEIHEYPVLPGDLYLLCSDGLNDMIEDEEIGMTLEALGSNLSLCAMQLIQMANDNGGRDNVSVILVRIKDKFPAPRGFWQRFLAWFH